MTPGGDPTSVLAEGVTPSLGPQKTRAESFWADFRSISADTPAEELRWCFAGSKASDQRLIWLKWPFPPHDMVMC